MLLSRINELPKVVADFIHLCGAEADEKGVNAYLVGGFVRDMILGVGNFDVDIVVEGDGIALASELARRLSLKVVAHRRFGTATISGLEGFKVDIASARKEAYEKPGALPVVRAGSIHDDAARRDFTINAMAVSINGAHFGKIFDPCGGREDVKKGLVRALHAKSFHDDPTRILRAARFEQRFGFRIEKETFFWIGEAVRQKMLQVTQKHRLRDELILILKERHPFRALRRLADVAGLSFIAPSLSFRKEWRVVFEVLDRRLVWFAEHFPHRRHAEAYRAYLALLFFPLAPEVIRRAIHEFAFHKGESAVVLALKEAFSAVERELRGGSVKPSVVYRALSPLPQEALLAFLAMTGDASVEKKIEDFLFLYKDKHIHVRGEDLARLGCKPGPRFKKILEAILRAKLDGEVRDKEEELALAARLICR